MKRFATLILFCTIATMSFAGNYCAFEDTSKNIVDKAKIQYKISDAKNKLYVRNIKVAMDIFKEVLQLDKKNAKANYGISECLYILKDYENSKKYGETAYSFNKEVDKEYNYHMANVYFRVNKLDKALELYTKFKESLTSPNKIIEYNLDLLIKQVKYAQRMTASPIDTKIQNIGKQINSISPEFAPCVSADGKKLIFTSRRADTKGGGRDINFDHKYYSDIYISNWNADTKSWEEAEHVSGKVNTTGHDGGLGFTPSGEMLIYSNIFGGKGNGDIYLSKQGNSGKWGTPKELFYKNKDDKKKINTSYWESSASMTADGKQIYFVSERPGGQGNSDIYFLKKKGSSWAEEVINLGAEINTANDEKCVFIHPSGKVLFFTSNGHEESMGSYDIYYCLREGKKWGNPINIGYPINTVNEEKTISVSVDGKTAYVSAYYSDIENEGSADIFVIDISYLNLDVEMTSSEEKK